MATLNATANRDFTASCGHVVKAGERLHMRRERALSYAHARNAGTMYPWNKRCVKCAPMSVNDKEGE